MRGSPFPDRLKDRKAASAGRSAVGVDVDRDVAVGGVEDPGPPVDARSDAVLVCRVMTTFAPSRRRSAARNVATRKLNNASV